jgi:hypothetical protein
MNILLKIALWIIAGSIGLTLLYGLFIIILFFLVHSHGRRNARHINKDLSNQYYLKDERIVYVMGGNFFEIGESDIENADAESFRVLDHAYAVDKNQVYYNGKPILGPDPDSAESISLKTGPSMSCNFLKDFQHVYCGSEVLENADPHSFSHLWGIYAMDQDSLYYETEVLTVRTSLPSPIKDSDNRWLQLENKIYYNGKLISSHGDSFKILNDDYSKDNSFVFKDGSILKDTDPDSFTILSPYFTADKNGAYYLDSPIKGSHSASFKFYNDTISSDKFSVYYEKSRIEGKSPADINRSAAENFAKRWIWRPLHLDESTVIIVPDKEVESINHNVCIYNNDVYGFDKKLIGITREALHIPDENNKHFIRIDRDIYYITTVIPEADPETFTVLSDNFSKDKRYVYWCEHRISGVDPDSFEYKEDLYAEEDETGHFVLAVYS